MTTIDFNALMRDAGDGFQPVPEGPYHVEVAKAEYKIAGTGKPMYAVQFRILSGPHAGRLVFNNFVIVADNPNALSFFFDHMEAMGLPRTFFASNPSPESVATALVGRQALISVNIRTEGQYAGRNDVSSVKPPPGGQIGGAPAGNVLAFPGQPAPVMSQVAPPQPPVPPAPVMPAVAQPPVPQPAPVAPVAPPQPVAPPVPVPSPIPQPAPEAYAPQPVAIVIPPAPAGVVAPPMPVAPPQPVTAPVPVQYEQPAPAPVAPLVYNPADEEPY